MSAESYRFKVGTFKCIAVTDGTLTYTASNFFVNAPKERLEQVLREHNLQPEQIMTPFTCLVINTGRHLALVDIGLGADIVPSAGKLLQNLQAEGIKPEDIDTVILTHGHLDHIGGNTDREGKPTFPNARYVMWKDEWHFWTSEANLRQMQIEEDDKQLLRNKLLHIQGQLELVDRETEILPGARAVPAPGHTPGHMALVISSGSEQLLCISDAVLHPIHLEQPDWYSIYDFAREQAATTRHQLLDLAMSEKAFVLAFHFPFPSLGYVIQNEERRRWQPIETTS